MHFQLVKKYPAILDSLESLLRKCTAEKDELLEMKEKAVKAAEDARVSSGSDENFEISTQRREFSCVQAKKHFYKTSCLGYITHCGSISVLCHEFITLAKQFLSDNYEILIHGLVQSEGLCSFPCVKQD